MFDFHKFVPHLQLGLAHVACVKRIWQVYPASKFYVEINDCLIQEVEPFYQMRILTKTQQVRQIRPQVSLVRIKTLISYILMPQ